MSRRTRILTLIIAAVAFLAPAPAAFAAAATPPAQPASGPGGAGYQWSNYVVRNVTFTDRTKDYWTYEPSGWQGSGAAPATAPLVVFLHGWLADDPQYYEDWIRHLVRKGNVLIFPRFQTSALTPPANFAPNAIFSIKDALTRLGGSATVKPDTARGMTLMAHSWGGPVSANIANRWAAESLPQPKSILFAEPYDRSLDDSLAGIPSTTKIDCVVGNEDTTTGRLGCDAIWDRTGHIPSSNRNYLWMFSDDHGSPALTADHRVPTSHNSDSVLNALDWYGFWKLGDGLRDCGLLGTNCDYALGNTARQTSLGVWSDGVPVRPMTVSTSKPACPAGTTAKGC
ncbi:alpha/beta hydrolase fold domain-containing protein [Actinomadura viridis]|uniref:Pimeloyl-ACP methyl ester carboxylesterase n=1 Tax=Actinomadura viridis TaxID=58110 RepID=A0A931DKK5_9ACTN|nr:hypothetical protein [Actinomadura viridis]MBG6091720.1 pimeloyl-ACP methyl ester carboxylesterase [Actinomadura viridis]